MTRPLWFLGVGIILALLVFCVAHGNAQEDIQLRLVEVNTTAFPFVSVTLLSADTRSAPADIANLSLSENGSPISGLTFSNIPSGIDVIFVLDANVGFDEIDDESGLTRRAKALASIRRFAMQYMNPDGLDTVSIVVPDEGGQSGRFLISEISTTAGIEQAIESYEPQTLGPTPLNAMISFALEQAEQRKDNGRYQAVLLFTDGRRLDQQLSFLQLVAQANDANVPIYSAILGASADPNEIANVSRLNDPTRAFYVHLDEPAAADPIYQIWQEQSNPVQVQYRSRQRQSGRNQLTINLGSTSISTSFEVTLAAPEVELSLDNTNIIRAGTAPDTPLNGLQPAIQPVGINIKWPDGYPRQISEAILIIDGRSERILDFRQDDLQGQVEFIWDISSLDEGPVELIVQVTDELGYQGISKPLSIEIAIDRPPLLPTPVPTAQVQETARQASSISRPKWDLLAAVVFILFLFLAALIWRRRRALAKNALAEKERGNTAGKEDASMRTADGMVLIVMLESLADSQREPLVIQGDDVTIGSQEKTAQIVLEDSSVSRLHARIRRQDDEFWLFDEGGSEGTYLNYERLGLAPQKLSDGDIVQFGKASYRFRLRHIVDLER